MTRKKLCFHRLQMYFLGGISEGNDPNFLDISEEKENLYKILNGIEAIPKFMEFKYKNRTVAIEFILGIDNFLKNKSGIICGKLSHSRDKHAYQLRTKGTSDEEEIATKENQLFEARSYFLIDTDSMIIAYLSERSAPQIEALGDWIYSTTKSSASMSTVWGQVTGIAIKNMINNLKKADYIGNIEYFMEIPADLAAEYTQLNESEYKKLQNQKFIRLRCQLVADKRGVSSFNDSKEVGGFFESLKNNSLIKRVKVKMKDKKEDHVKEVQLVNNPLNYSIDFNFDAIGDAEYDETISNRIQSEYILHKKEINDLYR
ncbi:hypothetical protein [Lactobacillus johnsonii]|uniref:hypothetical protein n=1 Tax=Lactobacillus johnsonii TaxID=33959 RepID=UPI00124B90CE|nr:hypothetical protein [Lactobacillus johnsonii]KAB1959033.1 hypothetical protein F8243_04375 [Lactobacillus johnsonii]MCT3346731.1 hypothetical protein [Lactobacillus johnsonii]